jgi:pimeloyl-ACP methyl ester carboxylesterase
MSRRSDRPAREGAENRWQHRAPTPAITGHGQRHPRRDRVPGNVRLTVWLDDRRSHQWSMGSRPGPYRPATGVNFAWKMAGDPHGKPILVHNGTPNSRHLYGRWIADADKKGIRLISYDRPGYGGSTAYPGHAVASGAQDVRAIAEALGYNRLGICASEATVVTATAVSGSSSERDGLAAGDQGWWDDGVSQVISWGFDLHDIRVPVKIWPGCQDRFVPVQHGQWLAASVPGAEADISDHDGHLTLIGRIGDIHDWLLQYF